MMSKLGSFLLFGWMFILLMLVITAKMEQMSLWFTLFRTERFELKA